MQLMMVLFAASGIAGEADSKKKRPFGEVVPVSWDGEIVASGARDAGARITSTQADASQERCLTPSRPGG
jgi:hypothetical protein